jgi:periplasmic copper chaperone A
MHRRTVSLPRPARRLAVLVAAVAGLLTLGTGIASAHVTVSSPDAAADGYGKVVFRVPDESDTANTVKVRIQLPTGTPFASVSYLPVPGWTATLTQTQLDPPLTDDDGNQVTTAVSVVEFDAAAGGGIAPGQFQEFALSAGPFPEADKVTFNVLQDYSDGSESAWIDPTVAGQAEPQHPAPVLSLAASSGSGGGSAATGSTSSASHDHTATGDSSAGLALFLAILALAVAVCGVVLGVVARRRTVSS